jgi:hypothetical protein
MTLPWCEAGLRLGVGGRGRQLAGVAGGVGDRDGGVNGRPVRERTGAHSADAQAGKVGDRQARDDQDVDRDRDLRGKGLQVGGGPDTRDEDTVGSCGDIRRGALQDGGDRRVLAEPVVVDAGVDEHPGGPLLDGADLRGVPFRGDEGASRAVLDVHPRRPERGHVVGHLAGIVAVAVLDVGRDVAGEPAQRPDEPCRGVLAGASAVGVPGGRADPEAGRTDGREPLVGEGDRRPHVPRVGEQERGLPVVQVTESHGSGSLTSGRVMASAAGNQPGRSYSSTVRLSRRGTIFPSST